MAEGGVCISKAQPVDFEVASEALAAFAEHERSADVSRILHIVPGLNDPTNGIAVAAKLIAARNGDLIVDAKDFRGLDVARFGFLDEVWVHSMWLPRTLRACWKVLRAGIPLVRMPHGCMDPVKVRYHWWKKMWVMPVEKYFMRRATRIVATEEVEAEWIKSFVRLGLRSTPTIQMLELNNVVKFMPRPGLGNRKFLFVGRMHPLKGVDVLIEAVRSLKTDGRLPADFQLTIIGKDEKGMRVGFESAAQDLPIRFLGEVDENVKRREMSVADYLVLPTLSENFGLVVKESLELGVPVITTDGAKYWKSKPGVTYIDGYLAASHVERVRLLKDAIEKFANG